MLRGLFARLSSNGDCIERRLSIACAIFALVVAFAGYRFGIAHGFDHWMPEPIEYENVKVAAALSNVVYGERQDFTADIRVYNALREHGFTVLPTLLEPLGIIFPANESDIELLNRGLLAASSLGHLEKQSGLLTGFVPVQPNELGGVDFYALAFRVFGVNIQSFFRFYSLLHVFSIVLFIAAFWRRLEAMMAMLAVVTCHFLGQAFLIGVPEDQIFGVATPYNQRFIATLGIVSALHIALMVLRPATRTLFGIALMAIQALLLAFILSIRSSTMWEVLWTTTAVAIFAAVLLAHHWKLLRWRLSVSPSEILGRCLSWPVMTFAAVFLLVGVVNDFRMNPVYRFSDEYLPHHMIWHSIYVSLGADPDWPGLFGKDFVYPNGQPVGTDEVPMFAAEKWLKSNYGLTQQYMLTPLTGGWRYRTTERIIREVYIDFLKRHPRFAVELHLIYKPELWYKNFIAWNRAAFSAMPRWGLTAFGASLLLMLTSAVVAGVTRPARVKCIAGVFAVGAVWALVPGIVIFASMLVMSDQATMMDVAIIGVLMWLAAWLANRYWRHLVSRGAGVELPAWER